jgi:hypothetical protein
MEVGVPPRMADGPVMAPGTASVGGREVEQGTESGRWYRPGRAHRTVAWPVYVVI